MSQRAENWPVEFRAFILELDRFGFVIDFNLQLYRFECTAPRDWDWLNDYSGAGALVDRLESEHDVLYMGRAV